MKPNEVLDLFREIEADIGDSDLFQVRSYSGRGMYGSKCIGITSTNALEAMMLLCTELASTVEDTSELIDLLNSFGKPMSDSMGLDQILYFPTLKYVELEEE